MPIRNVPVAHLDIDLSGDFTADQIEAQISAAHIRLDMTEGENKLALAFRWAGDPLHARLHALATGICKGMPKTVADATIPVIVVMDGDAGKTLGNLLVKELGVTGEVISIDNVQLREFDFIDVGEMIPESQVVPLIIKSLLFTQPGES